MEAYCKLRNLELLCELFTLVVMQRCNAALSLSIHLIINHEYYFLEQEVFNMIDLVVRTCDLPLFHFMIFTFIVFCLGANIHFKFDIRLHSSFQDCEQQWRETCESSLLWCSYSCVIFSVNSQETRLVKLILSCKLFLLNYF